MCYRSLLLISCLTLLASLAFADEPALVAKDLSQSNPENPSTLSGTENRTLATISPIDIVFISVGNTWEFYVRGRAPSDKPPTLIGVALPSGAVMTEVGDGWSLIYWQPKNEDVGRHVLTIRAVGEDDPNHVFERDIEVEVQPIAADRETQAMFPAPANPAVSATAGTTTSITAASLTSAKNVSEVTRVIRQETGRSSYIGSSEDATKEADKTPVDIETGANRQSPTLGPIATHIISAGKTLTVRVTPEHDNELPPIIHIDRLPPNASFDVNEDGSRTFYWPTRDSDQGQHRFRFTVIHPDDASMKSTRDMTVIVGDPSKQFTIPADR